MSWFLLILISTNLYALVSLFDKFLCDKKYKNIYAYSLSINLFSLIFILGLSFFIKFSFSAGWPLFLAILSGPVYFLMWLFWWSALKRTEVSRSAAIFNMSPIFNAFLAIVFLGEILSGFKWSALFLIVTGAILCSWEKKTKGQFNMAYLVVVLAAVIGAVGNIISKVSLKEIGPFALYAISFYAGIPFFIYLLTKRGVLEEVKENLKDKKIRTAVFLRAFISVVATCFFYLALSSGPVSLVAAVNGIGPLLVFFYSTLISFFWPKIIKEELSRQVLFSKAIAIILIVSGVVLINL